MGLIGDVAQLVADNKKLENLVGEILDALTVNMGKGLLRCINKDAYEEFLSLRKSWAARLEAATHEGLSATAESLTLAKAKDVKMLRCTPTVTRPSEKVDDAPLKGYGESKLPLVSEETLQEMGDDIREQIDAHGLKAIEHDAETKVQRAIRGKMETDPLLKAAMEDPHMELENYVDTIPMDDLDPVTIVIDKDIQVPDLDSETLAAIEQMQEQINKTSTSRLRELAEEMGSEPEKFVPDSDDDVELSDSAPAIPEVTEPESDKVVFNNRPFHDLHDSAPVLPDEPAGEARSKMTSQRLVRPQEWLDKFLPARNKAVTSEPVPNPNPEPMSLQGAPGGVWKACDDKGNPIGDSTGMVDKDTAKPEDSTMIVSEDAHDGMGPE